MSCTAGIPEFTCNAKPNKMNKFSIEVNNEIESEYIQKLAFSAGYKWDTLGPRYIGQQLTKEKSMCFDIYNKCIEFHHGTHEWVLYRFPSEASEIVKLFEKEKEPEFKKGDWLYFIGTKYLSDYWKGGKVCQYASESVGTSDDGTNTVNINEGGSNSKNQFRLATPSEIENHLIALAKEKGFVVGAKVESKEYMIRGSIDSIKYHNPNQGYTSIATDNYAKENGDHFLIVSIGTSSVPLAKFELIQSHPQIKINGYTAKFESWGLDFNNGCAKIDKKIFVGLNSMIFTDIGNKKIESVKIGSGEFTASQIKEIADYYNKQS